MTKKAPTAATTTPNKSSAKKPDPSSTSSTSGSGNTKTKTASTTTDSGKAPQQGGAVAVAVAEDEVVEGDKILVQTPLKGKGSDNVKELGGGGEATTTVTTGAENSSCEDKSKKTASSSAGSTNNNTLGYFLSNFVLPNPEKSQIYLTRLKESNNVLGSLGGNDSNLAFIGYGMLFLSEVLKYSSQAALASPSLLSSSALFSETSPIGPILQVLTKRYASHASSLVGPMRSLSSLISDIRIFNRLWGLVPLSVWAAETWFQPPSDSVLRGVAYSQVIANLLYQPLENVAYLAMHNIIPQSVVSERAQFDIWIYSSYLWAIHVVLEFVRLYRETVLAKRTSSAKNGGDDEKEKGGYTISSFAWYQSLVINLSYLPLTVHWSLPNGLVNDVTVGFLGATAAAASSYPKWSAIFS